VRNLNSRGVPELTIVKTSVSPVARTPLAIVSCFALSVHESDLMPNSCVVPSPANFIKPGKRPLSSISPTIVEYPDGSLYFVVGSAGGSRITTATIQNLWHVLDQGNTVRTSPYHSPLPFPSPSSPHPTTNSTRHLAQALAQPRLHDQLIPNQVSFEWPPFGYNNQTVAFMKSLGHNVTWIAPGQSTAQGLRRLQNGTFEAAGEPRQSNSGGYAV